MFLGRGFYEKSSAEVGAGLCLRLKPEEIEHYEETATATKDLLSDYAGSCDLLIDFRSIVNEEADRLATRAARLIRALELTGLRFSQIIVCSSNIPEKISEQVAKESSWDQPRMEWRLWERLCELLGRSEIVYGDYCVIYPEFFGAQKNKYINAKLRIADRDHYRLYRGKELYTEDGDPLQYRDLAREVLKLNSLSKLDSSSVRELRKLAGGQGKGSPGSLVPTEVCLHLDITSAEVAHRVDVLTETLAPAEVR